MYEIAYNDSGDLRIELLLSFCENSWHNSSTRNVDNKSHNDNDKCRKDSELTGSKGTRKLTAAKPYSFGRDYKAFILAKNSNSLALLVYQEKIFVNTAFCEFAGLEV